MIYGIWSQNEHGLAQIELRLRRSLIAVVAAIALAGCDDRQPAKTAGDATVVAHQPTIKAPQSHAVQLPKSSIRGPGHNVLLISVDTTRADHFGCYGHPKLQTPNIDRFAKEGALFKTCISSAPLTFPSHSTIMTGSYPYVHGARDNGIYILSDGNVTLAELFKQNDYVTHAEVAAAVLQKKFNLDQGFDTYHEPGEHVTSGAAGGEADADLLALTVELERKANEITEAGVKLIKEAVSGDQPFFIWLHYFDPHWPHEAPPRFGRMYPTEPYYAEIGYFDEQFGLLINYIRDSGISEKTLVVLTADHGEGRGQHSEYTHSSFLYDTTLHVPLIMWAPGRIPEGRVIESQVRTIDIAPTIAEFAGIDKSEQMQGISLLPVIEDPKLSIQLEGYSDTMVPRNMYKYSHLRSLRTDEWKYIHAPKAELYNVAEDPLEIFNLAPIEPDRTLQMREELRSLIEQSPQPPGGRATRQDPGQDVVADLAALGYVADVSAPEEDPLTKGSELDHFEPEGRNPKDHIEEIDCYATALGSFRLGQYDKSKIMLERLLELDPTSVAGWSMLGTTYMALKRHDDALEVYKKARALDNTDPTTHRHLGIVYLVLGQYDEAEKSVQESIKYAVDDWRGHALIARIFIAKREFEKAAEALEVADRLSTDNAEVRLRQGILHLQTRRPKRALELLKESIRLKPDVATAHFQLGRAYIALGEYEKAVHSFEQAMAITDELPGAYALCAGAHKKLGDHRKMIEVLRLGRKHTPDDVSIANDLAWWLATLPEDELRNGQEALRLATEAAANAGMEHYAELDTLAAAYAEVGQFDKAVATARRAAKLAAEAGLDNIKRDIESRVALYEQRKPYRSQ